MRASTELDLKALDVTDAQLAALLSMSARRVRQLAEEGTLVRTAPGRFNLAAAVRAMIEQASGTGSEFQRQRTRKMTADASTAELELARARAEVAPISEMENLWNMRCGLIKTNMMNIPRRAALQHLGCTNETEFKSKLREEIVLALQAAAENSLDADEPEETETEQDA